MKNNLQPTRATFSNNFQCEKAPRWLASCFHFRSEKGKCPPCIFEYMAPWIIDNIITGTMMLLYNKGCIKYDVYAQFQGWSNVLMLSPAREIVALRIKSIATKFTLNDKVIFIYITIYHHITIAIDGYIEILMYSTLFSSLLFYSWMAHPNPEWRLLLPW